MHGLCREISETICFIIISQILLVKYSSVITVSYVYDTCTVLYCTYWHNTALNGDQIKFKVI